MITLAALGLAILIGSCVALLAVGVLWIVDAIRWRR